MGCGAGQAGGGVRRELCGFEDSVTIASSEDPLPFFDLKNNMFLIDDLESVENCMLGENDTTPNPHPPPKSH